MWSHLWLGEGYSSLSFWYDSTSSFLVVWYLEPVPLQIWNHPFLQDQEEMILGRWQSRKHQKWVSPTRKKLHWQNLSHVNYFGTLSLLRLANSTEGLNDDLWLISVNFTSGQGKSHLFPTLSFKAGSCAQCTRSRLYPVYVSQGGQKGPCPPNSGVLWSDWLLLLISEEQTKRQGCYCTSSHCYKLLSGWLKWLTGDLKDHCPFLLFIFLFSPFGNHTFKN